jgi:hypothetical protein
MKTALVIKFFYFNWNSFIWKDGRHEVHERKLNDSSELIEVEDKNVFFGGMWSPPDCQARHKVSLYFNSLTFQFNLYAIGDTIFSVFGCLVLFWIYKKAILFCFFFSKRSGIKKAKALNKNCQFVLSSHFDPIKLYLWYLSITLTGFWLTNSRIPCRAYLNTLILRKSKHLCLQNETLTGWFAFGWEEQANERAAVFALYPATINKSINFYTGVFQDSENEIVHFA